MCAYFIYFIIQFPFLIVPYTKIRWFFRVKSIIAPVVMFVIMGVSLQNCLLRPQRIKHVHYRSPFTPPVFLLETAPCWLMQIHCTGLCLRGASWPILIHV